MKRDPLWREIADDKAASRREAAAKPFDEMLRIVEKLRARDAAVRASARTGAGDSQSAPKK